MISSGRLKAFLWEASLALLLPLLSTDLVLTELTTVEQPFCLSSCMLIDLFLWIYVKENQHQFSLAHLASCKLHICDNLGQKVLYYGVSLYLKGKIVRVPF